MFFRKKDIPIFIVLLGVSGLYFQCNKKRDCRETAYGFEIGIKAYPDKDSVSVGDTVWLEVNEPTTLKDLQTDRMIDFNGASNLGTAISFAELIAVGSTNDNVASKFNYLLMSGHEVQRPDTIKYREFNFLESNGVYRFKLAIIPIEKGVFKMFVSNASNVYRSTDKCIKANFQINFIETDQHFYYNKISFPGIVLSGKNGVYLFKVK